MIAAQMAPTEILRWVPCDECSGTGGGTSFSGEVSNSGMGPTHVPGQVEWECRRCDHGYVQVDEGDSRWDAGTLAHPDD